MPITAGVDIKGDVRVSQEIR